MKHSLLDSSDRDESNVSYFMSLKLLNDKLFTFFYFHIFTNILLFINLKNIKQLSLDASCYDESNEPCFIVF